MVYRKKVSLVLSVLLALLPMAAWSQLDPGVRPVWVLEILDPSGLRVGLIVIAGESRRGFEAGKEYWTFSERALLEIAEQESLEFSNLAMGEWDDPWVVEALRWRPADRSVSWNHPAEVEWTEQADSLPPVAGTFFGNPNLGGLMVQYSKRGPASLTWFKTTDGAFMQLEDGGLFKRDDRLPETGSWWHGPIED